MNLIFRLIYTILIARFRSRVSPLGPCLTPFRVLPTDLDVLRHMNNGVYFSILDLARVDLMNRAGFARKISAEGWYPVVVAETMRFRKSLGLFQKFMVETTLLSWDDKALILQQRFLCGDQVMAEAVIRARFLKKTGGSVTPAQILELAEVAEVKEKPRALPEWTRAWNEQQASQ